MPVITDPELNQIATSFQQLAVDSFGNASEDTQQELLNRLNSTLRDFTRDWRAESGQGCPDGWDECPDGSCVPAGSGCSEILDLQAVNAYIRAAASVYFENAQSEEMKERTRELLNEARQRFIFSANSEVAS